MLSAKEDSTRTRPAQISLWRQVFSRVDHPIFVTRTGGPRLILSSARTALARGVSGCSKRSEDENLYFVLFTQTEETGQNFGSCLPVERGSGGASVSEIACLSYERGKCFEETHNPARVSAVRNNSMVTKKTYSLAGNGVNRISFNS